jgi:hypothetical protein
MFGKYTARLSLADDQAYEYVSRSTSLEALTRWYRLEPRSYKAIGIKSMKWAHRMPFLRVSASNINLSYTAPYQQDVTGYIRSLHLVVVVKGL